jgi:hypothetical protein
MTALFQKLRQSEFRAEWCAVAAAIGVDAIWARAIGFHLLLGWQSGLVIAGIAAAYGLVRGFFSARLGLLAEYVCLSLAGSAALLVFSYLSLASAPGPLADQQLLAADRALGFDWISLYRGLMAHGFLAATGKLVYQSLLLQGLYCTILLSLMQQRPQMKELWRLTFTVSVMCCLIGMLFPALGPYKDFGLDSEGVFLPDMEHLLSHHDLTFAPGSMTGVVCFPSLHTAMALAYPYGLRRTGPIFYIFAGLNFLMLFTIPFFGGHYLVDMIAGAGVMLAALGFARISVFGWRARQSSRAAGLAENPA